MKKIPVLVYGKVGIVFSTLAQMCCLKVACFLETKIFSKGHDKLCLFYLRTVITNANRTEDNATCPVMRLQDSCIKCTILCRGLSETMADCKCIKLSTLCVSMLRVSQSPKTFPTFPTVL